MAQFIIPAVDGTYTKELKTGKFHDLCIKPTEGTMTAGTFTFKCRPMGGATFNDVPDNVVDLSDAEVLQVQFTGSVEAYEFTLSGFTGTATKLIITDFCGWA
mgnify:CR=1 FL=1|tara:strand:- start:123 stop:428 length:306 start_codon:yes stop_codon:yes gene_type:complete